MALAQKPDFVFRRNGRVHLNRQERQFSPLLAAEVCASAVIMLDTPSSEIVWRVLATYSIRQFPLHFPSRASTCSITFQLDSTKEKLTMLFLGALMIQRKITCSKNLKKRAFVTWKELKCVRNFYVQLCLLSFVLCALQYNEFTIGRPRLLIKVFHAKDYWMHSYDMGRVA